MTAVRSQLDQAVVQRNRYCIRPVGSAKLTNRRLHVFVDGPLRDAEDLTDLPRRLTIRDPAKNFALPGSQLGLRRLSSGHWAFPAWLCRKSEPDGRRFAARHCRTDL